MIISGDFVYITLQLPSTLQRMISVRTYNFEVAVLVYLDSLFGLELLDFATMLNVVWPSDRLEDNEKLVLTPFEKNLDIWRQLWRVLERCDLVCVFSIGILCLNNNM